MLSKGGAEANYDHVGKEERDLLVALDTGELAEDWCRCRDAGMIGARRRDNYRLIWKEKWFQGEPDDVIARVLYDEAGRLSGTMRIVKGNRQIAIVHFPFLAATTNPEDDDSRPSIVAFYCSEEWDVPE